MTPPGGPVVAQVLAPGLALLGEQGVTVALRALDLAEKLAARDGIRLPPQARELRDQLRQALPGSGFGTCSHARAGTTEPVAVPGRALSPQDVIDVQEVARVLEVSDRYARRLLVAGVFETGRKVAGRWQVDQLEVQAMAGDRQEARTA